MTEPLRAAIAAIDGVVESGSRYKPDLAYWVNGTEIAHFETPSVLDLRLTRAVISTNRSSLRSNRAVTLRPGSSDWISVNIEVCGLSGVLGLVELAAAAHRAPPGATPRPPGRPGGAR